MYSPGGRASHDVVGAVADPSFFRLKFWIGRFFLNGGKVFYPVEQWHVALRQSGWFSRPVIHFDVDVGGIL